MNEETNNEKETKEVVNSPKSNYFKDALTFFLEDYPQAPKIIGITLGVLLVVGFSIYFFVYYKPPMVRYADQFCNCASKPSTDEKYSISLDEFEYVSSMNSCFAEDFGAYSEGFSIKQKKACLLEFKKNVTKKCPEKLNVVFKYE